MKVLFAALLVGVALSATGAAAPQASPCCGEDFDPQWSSDGSRIAFIRQDPTGLSAVFTMAAQGGDERRLMSLGSDFQPNASRQRPLLSPDWTRLALIVNGAARGRPALKIESVDGSHSRLVGTDVVSFAWSPGGRHIAFHETDTGKNSTIFAAQSDGSGLRSLGAGEAPAWSPDSDRIVFVAPNGKLYVMQADGSGRRLVFDGNGAVIYEPSWSPLGDQIAFYSASNLWVVELSGRIVAYSPTDYELKPPRWSFDGTLLAVESPPRLSAFRIATKEHWQFDGRRDATWSPVADELALSFDGPCRRNGIYRLSVPSTSRRLTQDCHIRGTDGPDVLTGTPSTDIITGLAGDDELSGGDGQDRLSGGAGDDTLLGGKLGDRLEGGYGADLLIGGSFEQDPLTNVDDSLLGGPGPDDLRGGPGRDSLNGDAGNDVLRGGPDADTLIGGPGNDRILASGDPRDGSGRAVRDIVYCGGGRHDVAFVDRADRVSGCETVHRR